MKSGGCRVYALVDSRWRVPRTVPSAARIRPRHWNDDHPWVSNDCAATRLAKTPATSTSHNSSHRCQNRRWSYRRGLCEWGFCASFCCLCFQSTRTDRLHCRRLLLRRTRTFHHCHQLGIQKHYCCLHRLKNPGVRPRYRAPHRSRGIRDAQMPSHQYSC